MSQGCSMVALETSASRRGMMMDSSAMLAQMVYFGGSLDSRSDLKWFRKAIRANKAFLRWIDSCSVMSGVTWLEAPAPARYYPGLPGPGQPCFRSRFGRDARMTRPWTSLSGRRRQTSSWPSGRWRSRKQRRLGRCHEPERFGGWRWSGQKL